MLRALRWIFFLALAVAIGVYVNRSRRTVEQVELTEYVEHLLPRFLPAETAIDERLSRLQKAPGLSAEKARTLLVDEVIPGLLTLRGQASEARWETSEVSSLAREYVAAIDAQIDACRTCVRVIDDPKLDTKTATSRVVDTFAAATAKRTAWKQHVDAMCRLHGLVGKAPLPTLPAQ